ncbi:ribosome biogenesis protein [Candidatus Woesearchaeota archaeon]|nr:ribosome biogenesis protein [Candidatus Woesearchaeota archaeon]
MRHIFKCPKCERYTMQEKCACGPATETAKPAKFSPEDKYSIYRRKAKEDARKKEGLI